MKDWELTVTVLVWHVGSWWTLGR